MLNCFNIQDKIEIEISKINNSSYFDIDDLFQIGLRINPKRSFLFVSKLLGKHLAVHPETPKATGYLLAQALRDSISIQDTEKNEESLKAVSRAIATGYFTEDVKLEINKTLDLNNNILFVGFAETATGLGHAVASVFPTSSYVHTTRSIIDEEISIFNFEEEHSHATSHRCYLNEEMTKNLSNIDEIVLIDDEITTGNTALNLIKSLNKKYDIKKYTVLSILDWRDEENLIKYKEFQEEYSIEVNCISMFKGNLEIKKEEIIEKQKENKENITETMNDGKIITNRMKNRKNCSYENINGENITESLLVDTGRFGIYGEGNKKLEAECKEIGLYLKSMRQGKTLCVGTEELIYIPSRIASYMGGGVAYKSSTRSPIWITEDEDYVINDKLTYDLGDGINKYIYNLKGKGYTEVFIFFEGNLIPGKTRNIITEQLANVGIDKVNFVFI